MRIDAELACRLAGPLRPLFERKVRRLPILMYHSVSTTAEVVHPYYRICTHPSVFRSHIQYLKEAGYTAIGIGPALEWLRSGAPAGMRPVVITFDDGYRDFYTDAFPALNDNGFTATVYLPTAAIGGRAATTFTSKPLMMWKDVKELHAAGIEFGSHTVTHPVLVTKPLDDVRNEFAASKDTIQQYLGCAIDSCAYPYAYPEGNREFCSKLDDILSDIGYDSCVTTRIGTERPGGFRLRLKRLPVNSSDDHRLFRAKLAGDYDCIGAVQSIWKVLWSYAAYARGDRY